MRRPGGCTDLELEKFGVNVRIQLPELCDGRYDAPFEHENGLDHAGDARGTFEMADAGLHRTTTKMLSAPTSRYAMFNGKLT